MNKTFENCIEKLLKIRNIVEEVTNIRGVFKVSYTLSELFLLGKF